MVDESVIGYSADGKDRARMLPGELIFELLDSTCAHKWFSNSPSLVSDNFAVDHL